MPELPEVETIARGLTAKLKGKVIRAAHIHTESIIEGSAAEFKFHLEGKRVAEVTRHGKFLFLPLSDLNSQQEPTHLLKIHLGMTGQLLFEDPKEPVLKHTHVVFKVEGMREDLRYRDIRRFGYLQVQKKDEGSRLGPDAWSTHLTGIFSTLRKRSGMLKHTLLNQGVLAGLGNIYVDESLYRCGLHPRKNIMSLNNQKLQELCGAIREVLAESINVGGTSFRNYVDTKGGRGGYKGRLRVYGKTGESCMVCGTSIQRIVVAGRGSHICPRCQPEPRTRPLRKRK